jgi:phosphotriesterase-related protein
MKQVQTVLGPVDPGELGKTLAHEHFVLGHPGWEGDRTIAGYDREAIIQKGVQMAEDVKKYGVKTVVDATTNEFGRSPDILKEISEKSGLNVICTCGYYNEAHGAPRYFNTLSQFADGGALVYELMKKEVTEGIGDTGIKAGILKIATDKEGPTDYERMFISSAAKVSKEEDVPIFTHTEEGTLGPEQADLLISEGADPKRIMIGHSCGNTDVAYLQSILDKGVYIGFDRFGIEGVFGTPLNKQRQMTLIGLIKMGYASQIMLSHDWINYWLSRPLVDNIVASFLPQWKPTHIFEDILPVLKEADVTDEQIDIMMVGNPRRFFGGE